jgi:hypothetical protein
MGDHDLFRYVAYLSSHISHTARMMRTEHFGATSKGPCTLDQGTQRQARLAITP